METKPIVIREGDTLMKLAARHLDDGTRWPEIYHANLETIVREQRRRGLTPRNPEDLIFPGTVLDVPDAE